MWKQHKGTIEATYMWTWSWISSRQQTLITISGLQDYRYIYPHKNNQCIPCWSQCAKQSDVTKIKCLWRLQKLRKKILLHRNLSIFLSLFDHLIHVCMYHHTTERKRNKHFQTSSHFWCNTSHNSQKVYSWFYFNVRTKCKDCLLLSTPVNINSNHRKKIRNECRKKN